jgi:hypothetical protein
VALIILGSTECAACGHVLVDDDEVVGLPHFATGSSDPHRRYTDAGFHLKCWQELPEREAIEARIRKLDAQHGYPPRF